MARHDITTDIHINAYTVLNLAPPSHNRAAISAADVKKAYRRALLRWHPDKSPSVSGGAGSSAAASPTPDASKAAEAKQPAERSSAGEKEAPYAVDDITAAYRTLSSPARRRELDAWLATRPGAQRAELRGEDRAWLSGLELVDLDDLTFVEGEGEGSWYKPCRCGSGRGFVVRESELEEEVERGEVLVGCGGCSLWIRVGFGVVEG